MAPLQITCTGESTVFCKAERAVVFITISSDGPSQSEVSQDVIKTANAVQSHLKTMAVKDESGQVHPDAAIANWSMSSLYTGSWQAIDDDGRSLPRKFTASTKLEVNFRDFTVLGRLTSNLSETQFVSIDRIDWRLTDETKASQGRQCRRNAVKDAMMKAKDYADAAGKTDFEILEITDVQGSTDGYVPPSGRMFGAAPGGVGGREELNFEPEDVSVSSSITAKFDAA